MTNPYPTELPGLCVDFGEYDLNAHRWIRPPAAVFTCFCGHHSTATGVAAVARFALTVPAAHRRACPRRSR